MAALSLANAVHKARHCGWKSWFWSLDWPLPGSSASRQLSTSASAQATALGLPEQVAPGSPSAREAGTVPPDPTRTAVPAGPPAATGRPPRSGPPRSRPPAAWASVREPISMRSCGRRRRSAASATSSSGTTWRRTSRSPRPRALPTHLARTACLAALRVPGSTRDWPPARRPSRPRRTTGNGTTGPPVGAGGSLAPAPMPRHGPDLTQRPNGPRSSPPTRRRSRSRA